MLEIVKGEVIEVYVTPRPISAPGEVYVLGVGQCSDAGADVWEDRYLPGTFPRRPTVGSSFTSPSGNMDQGVQHACEFEVCVTTLGTRNVRYVHRTPT